MNECEMLLHDSPHIERQRRSIICAYKPYIIRPLHSRDGSHLAVIWTVDMQWLPNTMGSNTMQVDVEGLEFNIEEQLSLELFFIHVLEMAG